MPNEAGGATDDAERVVSALLYMLVRSLEGRQRTRLVYCGSA